MVKFKYTLYLMIAIVIAFIIALISSLFDLDEHVPIIYYVAIAMIFIFCLCCPTCIMESIKAVKDQNVTYHETKTKKNELRLRKQELELEKEKLEIEKQKILLRSHQASDNEMSFKICRLCGKEIPTNVRICPYCSSIINQ